MKAAVISFTQEGMELSWQVKDVLEQQGYDAACYVKSKYVQLPEEARGILVVEQSLSQWAEAVIPQQDALVFIGAAGIAVRTIAPFIKSKVVDPAVLVLDEKGEFVIPLLSGHIGGANELAGMLGRALHSTPVYTTATDVNQKFAVDVWTTKNQLALSNLKLAKEVAALVLKDAPLLCGLGQGYCGKLPENFPSQWKIITKQDAPDGKRGTFWIQLPDGQVLHGYPKNVVLGIGCRKDTPYAHLKEQMEQRMQQAGLVKQQLAAIASIDLKKEEPALVKLAKDWELPFLTYAAEELLEVEGTFTPSSFVSHVTGVDNVCERSCVKASEGGTLLIKKQAAEGVTLAAALKKWSVDNA